MTLRRAATLLAATVLLSGCSSLFQSPTAPAADDTTPRQVVAGQVGFVLMLPASPRGAQVGIDYAYTMPMCGASGPIDVDGSFWDVATGGDGIDWQSGVFRLTTPASAVFTWRDGQTASLTRHDGAKEFPICH